MQSEHANYFGNASPTERPWTSPILYKKEAYPHWESEMPNAVGPMSMFYNCQLAVSWISESYMYRRSCITGLSPGVDSNVKVGEAGFLLLYIGAGGTVSSTAVAPVDP